MENNLLLNDCVCGRVFGSGEMSKTGRDGRRKLGQREGSKENLVE